MLYWHFWVYFDINLKLLSGKNTQKVNKQNIGCSMSWTRYNSGIYSCFEFEYSLKGILLVIFSVIKIVKTNNLQEGLESGRVQGPYEWWLVWSWCTVNWARTFDFWNNFFPIGSSLLSRFRFHRFRCCLWHIRWTLWPRFFLL